MKQDGFEDNEISKDEGSVWTSYSDLFVTVSVIFLVMFVFALIRTSLATFQQEQAKKETKDYLNGKTSKKEKKRIDEQKTKITSSIEKINEYNSKISKRKEELDRLVKELKQHQSVISNVLVKQKEKDGLINHLKTELKNSKSQAKALSEKVSEAEKLSKVVKTQYEKTIKARENEFSRLQKKFEKQSKTLKVVQKKERKLSSNLDRQVQKIRKQIENASRARESKLLSEKADLRKYLKELQKELVRERAQNAETSKNLKKSTSRQLAELKSSQAKEIKSLKSSQARANAEHAKEVRNLEGQLKGLKAAHAKETASLKNAHGAEVTELKEESGRQLAALKKSHGREVSGLKKNHGREVAGLKKNHGQEVAGLQSKNKKLSGLRETLAQKNYDCEVEKRENLRQHTVDRIAARLGKLSNHVRVDPKTGNLVLQLGETFFENDSSKITKEAQRTLASIIPGYATELMKNDQIWRDISTITIVGHSSPRYGGKAVDPNERKSLAYKYNKYLSKKRAEAITKFIRGMVMKDVPEARQFFKKMRSLGMGYEKPVRLKKNRKPASEESLGCGPFDCVESRRVEIVFTLNKIPKTMNLKERSK